MKIFLISFIKFYQDFISPFKFSCCRFIPTCSEYALEAIKIYGLRRGVFLSVKRILRCNPFCKWGFDPVPKNSRFLKDVML